MKVMRPQNRHATIHAMPITAKSLLGALGVCAIAGATVYTQDISTKDVAAGLAADGSRWLSHPAITRAAVSAR